MLNLKERFLQVYANLPSNSRLEIIAVIDGEPYTWNSARIEVVNETEKSKKIIDQLISLGILKDEK